MLKLKDYIKNYDNDYYFLGQPISNYGVKNNRVDYACIAKSIIHILNNDILEATGFENWECISGYIDNSDELEELREKLEEIEDMQLDMIHKDLEDTSEYDNLENEFQDIKSQIESLESEQYNLPEIYQWYIIDTQNLDILEAMNETIYYNSDLDVYLWGIDHYGTSWDYVMTNIEIK